MSPSRGRGLERGQPSEHAQDGRPLRRYCRRWHVERLFAWMMRFRRLVTRYEHNARNFLGSQSSPAS